jgi:thiamine kinase-like enzyme
LLFVCRRIAKKAWKHTGFATKESKASPEPQFEALLVGATNKCFKITYQVSKLSSKRNNHRVAEENKKEDEQTFDRSHLTKKPLQDDSLNGRSETSDHVDRVAFMRVQGAGSVLSNPREQELAIFQYCSKYELGPRLYAVFENGYLAEFMRGRVVAVDEMSEPWMMEKIARLTANWHRLQVPSTVAAKRLISWKGRKPLKSLSLHANTWSMIGKWLQRAKRLYAAEDAVALCSGQDPTFHRFSCELLSTQRDLLPFYAQSSSIVLCHNDLNHGNLLWDANRSQLLAVDLEFSGINHRGFDLGNHFCEWAGLELQYQKCPSDDQIRLWCSFYLDSFGGFCHTTASSGAQATCCHHRTSSTSESPESSFICGSSSQSSSSSLTSSSSSSSSSSLKDVPHISKEELIEEMLVESRKWMQASHLFWWLWAMIQIKISNIEGFDAKNYAEVRWNEYTKHKESRQALKHPERLLANCPTFDKVYRVNPSSSETTATTASRSHRRRRSSSLKKR